MQNQNHFTAPKDSKTHYIILIASIFSLFFILYLSSAAFRSPSSAVRPDPSLFPNLRTHSTLFTDSSPPPPSIAYLISGSRGDSGRILRLLFAAYHPRNRYLLHLDLSAPQSDRDSLAVAVQSVPVFAAAGNVDVVGKADFSYPKGSSAVSSMLHGAAILLRLSSTWDWFINLSAEHYPLVTQDDLLHILSYLRKGLNFVNLTSHVSWRESRRLRPIIVDPGLYILEETQMFYATQKRDLPNAYRLFTGSSSSVVSREFIEFCISGSDNLPRTLLMYLSNTLSPLPNYFPTLLCNSPQFNRTIVGSLQYASLNSKQEPQLLKSGDFDDMIKSGTAFASPFPYGDRVLDRIDQEVLSRRPGETVPGGWCLGESANDTCSVWGNADILRPGPGARRLEKHITGMLSNGTLRSQQCT